MLSNPSPVPPYDEQKENSAFSMVAAVLRLDTQIESGGPILYKSKDFSKDSTVGEFIGDHRPLRTAMFGTLVALYSDPCTCCIPAYGQRKFDYKTTDPDAILGYVREARESGHPVDVLFLNEKNYREMQAAINDLSPETKLIVGCDRRAPTEASELRKQGIAAISEEDYLNCAPLNAMIALVAFREAVE